jgi:hypothetical protein
MGKTALDSAQGIFSLQRFVAEVDREARSM